jgi:hypothetical protein
MGFDAGLFFAAAAAVDLAARFFLLKSRTMRAMWALVS